MKQQLPVKSIAILNNQLRFPVCTSAACFLLAVSRGQLKTQVSLIFIPHNYHFHVHYMH